MIWTPRPDVTDWERWFAWRPVDLEDGRAAWLSTVERRCAGLLDHEEGSYRDWRYKSLAAGRLREEGQRVKDRQNGHGAKLIIDDLDVADIEPIIPDQVRSMDSGFEIDMACTCGETHRVPLDVDGRWVGICPRQPGKQFSLQINAAQWRKIRGSA